MGLYRPLELKEVETSRISSRSANESGPEHQLPLLPSIGDNPNSHFRQGRSAAGTITSLKIPITPSAMKLTTFRLVTQFDPLRML